MRMVNGTPWKAGEDLLDDVALDIAFGMNDSTADVIGILGAGDFERIGDGGYRRRVQSPDDLDAATFPPIQPKKVFRRA